LEFAYRWQIALAVAGLAGSMAATARCRQGVYRMADRARPAEDTAAATGFTPSRRGQPIVVRWSDRIAQTPVMNGVMMAEDVRAEIVASVLEVVVKEGDQIGEGDTLVLLESMKMEIPVLAEVAGTVSKVSVSVGDVIQAGDLIAVIS
jgi:biotin carboxyl carrier protein